MGTDQDSIDWRSLDNHVLLNPRWSKEEMDSLNEVADSVTKKRTLQGHIWLATSGSTSSAVTSNKLVALSKGAFLASARAVNQHLGVTSKDVWLQVLPRFHVGGLGIEARGFLSQSRVVRNFQKWDPGQTASLLLEEKITLASFVPTQVFDLVQAGLKAPSALRAVIVGGGALNPSLYKSACDLGWALLPSYGMTETCSQIATASLNSVRSVETPMPLPQKLDHVQWRKTKDGLLAVRGDSLLTCYSQRQPDGAIHDWDPKQDHWFQTEDFVKLHTESGEVDMIEFLGRKNDFLKIGGEGTSLTRLREIFERILLGLGPRAAGQNVLCVLIDAPSARLGSEIHLVYESTLSQGLLQEIKETYNREVLPFERVRQLREVEKIPRSELGKALWAQLKKDLYD